MPIKQLNHFSPELNAQRSPRPDWPDKQAQPTPKQKQTAFATTSTPLDWVRRMGHLVNASGHHVAGAAWATLGQSLKSAYPSFEGAAQTMRAHHQHEAQTQVAKAQALGAVTNHQAIKRAADLPNYAASLMAQGAVPLASIALAARTGGAPAALVVAHGLNTAFNVSYQLDMSGQANLAQAAVTAIPATVAQIGVGAAFPRLGPAGWAPGGALVGSVSAGSQQLSTLGMPLLQAEHGASLGASAFDGALLGLLLGPASPFLQPGNAANARRANTTTHTTHNSAWPQGPIYDLNKVGNTWVYSPQHRTSAQAASQSRPVAPWNLGLWSDKAKIAGMRLAYPPKNEFDVGNPDDHRPPSADTQWQRLHAAHPLPKPWVGTSELFFALSRTSTQKLEALSSPSILYLLQEVTAALSTQLGLAYKPRGLDIPPPAAGAGRLSAQEIAMALTLSNPLAEALAPLKNKSLTMPPTLNQYIQHQRTPIALLSSLQERLVAELESRIQLANLEENHSDTTAWAGQFDDSGPAFNRSPARRIEPHLDSQRWRNALQQIDGKTLALPAVQALRAWLEYGGNIQHASEQTGLSPQAITTWVRNAPGWLGANSPDALANLLGGQSTLLKTLKHIEAKRVSVKHVNRATQAATPTHVTEHVTRLAIDQSLIRLTDQEVHMLWAYIDGAFSIKDIARIHDTTPFTVQHMLKSLSKDLDIAYDKSAIVAAMEKLTKPHYQTVSDALWEIANDRRKWADEKSTVPVLTPAQLMHAQEQLHTGQLFLLRHWAQHKQLSTKDQSAILPLNEKTIGFYRSKIYTAFGVKNIWELDLRIPGGLEKYLDQRENQLNPHSQKPSATGH